MKKLDIGQSAKVLVYWNTSEQITTKEEEKNIITAFAEKYGIPAKNIRCNLFACVPINENFSALSDI